MSRRFTVKRLTASDLGFFAWHQKLLKPSKQKGINLNADVFVKQLYPNLTRGEIKVGLTLFGPACVTPLKMTRTLRRSGASKNWRLNGETVSTEHAEFVTLKVDDYALIVFEGEGRPEDIVCVFFAANKEADQAAVQVLRTLVPQTGNRSMRLLTEAELLSFAQAADLPADHAVRSLIIDEVLIEAAAGSSDATRRFLNRGRNVRLDKETLRKARAAAEDLGDLGEALIDLYLEAQQDRGELVSYTWLARQNAIAPMDFESTTVAGTEQSIEVKTTSGEFERPFHVPLSELREAALSTRMYAIYRVYRATTQGGVLRISEDFKPLACSILDALQALPKGVTPDGVTVAPSLLVFGNPSNWIRENNIVADVLTAEQRRFNMSRIRGRNTKPEMLVRRILHALGYRYRIHVRDLPGTPDIVFASRRKVIFVHGCFWHGHEGCRFATSPATNTEFWRAKIGAARLRHVRAITQLSESAWSVLVIWECEMNSADLSGRLQHFLGSKRMKPAPHRWSMPLS